MRKETSMDSKLEKFKYEIAQEMGLKKHQKRKKEKTIQS